MVATSPGRQSPAERRRDPGLSGGPGSPGTGQRRCRPWASARAPRDWSTRSARVRPASWCWIGEARCPERWFGCGARRRPACPRLNRGIRSALTSDP